MTKIDKHCKPRQANCELTVPCDVPFHGKIIRRDISFYFYSFLFLYLKEGPLKKYYAFGEINRGYSRLNTFQGSSLRNLMQLRMRSRNFFFSSSSSFYFLFFIYLFIFFNCRYDPRFKPLTVSDFWSSPIVWVYLWLSWFFFMYFEVLVSGELFSVTI